MVVLSYTALQKYFEILLNKHKLSKVLNKVSKVCYKVCKNTIKILNN